jgi:hypothetical protein
VQVDGGEAAADGDEVVQVVDVVRYQPLSRVARMKAYLTPIFLNSSRTQPTSWSTLLADTSGQFVYQERRQEARAAKQACNAGDEKTRAECRQVKRHTRQAARQGKTPAAPAPQPAQ